MMELDSCQSLLEKQCVCVCGGGGGDEARIPGQS